MNLVIETLKARRSPSRLLEFNPWQWGESQAISRALFLQIAGKLGGPLSVEAVRRARLMRRYGGVLQGAGGALKGNVEAHSASLTTWLGVLATAGLFGLQLPDWTEGWSVGAKDIVKWTLAAMAAAVFLGKTLQWLGRDQTERPLDELREELDARLRKLRGPLIVFVDDIDRLEAEQIRLVIRQVKANANLPNIVFVLLFQPGIVETALDAISGGEGVAYLEKIVQANFDLPAPSQEDVQRVFTNELQGLIGPLAIEANGFAQVRWGNVLLGGILPFLGTLRDTRRLLSSVAIHTPLHKGPKAFEVNIIDLLALETLRVFEPTVHAAIAANKALLLQSSRFRDDGAHDRNRDDVNEILARASVARRETVQNLLIELFPTISGLLRNRHFGADWRQSWLAEKRVCTERMFDRYFDLQVRSGVLSESDFQAFLESSADAATIANSIAALKAGGLLPSLATRVDEGVAQLPLDNISVILPALFELGREMLAASAGEAWNTPYISSWRAASWFLRRVPEPERRSAILEAAIRGSNALSVPAVLISLDQDERVKGGDRDLLFDEAGFERLKALWVERIQAVAAQDAALLEADDLVSLLYRWRDFSGGFDEPRAFVASRTQGPAQLASMLAHFVTVSTVHAFGDRVSSKREMFQRQSLEDFFSLAQLEHDVAQMDVATLPENEARIVGVLRQHLTTWRTQAGPGE